VSLRRKETHCGPRRRKDSQLRIIKVIKPIHSKLRRNGILCSTIFFNAAQYPLGARVSVAGVAEAAHGGAAGLRNDVLSPLQGLFSGSQVILQEPQYFRLWIAGSASMTRSISLLSPRERVARVESAKMSESLAIVMDMRLRARLAGKEVAGGGC